MSTRTTAIKLGIAFQGLTLHAQAFDSAGVDQGGQITSGFVDMGQGDYAFTTSSTYSLFRIINAETGQQLTIASIDDSASSSAVSISVTPISTTVVSPNVDEKHIAVYQNTATTLSFTATDGSGQPLSLASHALVFRVFDDYFDADQAVFEIAGGAMTISGSTVAIPITTANTAVAAKHSYSLRDLTASTVLSTGTFEIRALP